MLDPIDTIEKIFTVAKLIYDQVKLAQANQEQCNRLAARVKIVESAVRNLEKIKNKNQYRDGLTALLKSLNDCLEFIKAFSVDDSWFKKALKILQANGNQEKFNELNEELQKAINQLNLGLNAQQLFNREDDVKDQKKDFDYLKKNQNKIIELNITAIQKIERLDANEQERHEIVVRQISSVARCVKQSNSELKIEMHDIVNQAMQQYYNLFLKAMEHQTPKMKNSSSAVIDPRYSVSSYELIFSRKLSTQHSGENIYLGFWSNKQVAIKTLEGSYTPKEEEKFIREINITSRLQHENIVTFYGAGIEEGKAFIIMEYMRRGSLQEILSKEKLSLSDQFQIAADIASGLRYLHNQKMFHRNLNSNTILLDENNTAKIADFGFTKVNSNSIQTVNQRSEKTEWFAPECFKPNYVYTAQADIYSFGVILSKIATDQKEKVWVELIKDCQNPEPDKRPSLDVIINTLAEEIYKLGIACEQKKNDNGAKIFYERAAKFNYARAFTNLGLFAVQGRGGIKLDKSQAHQYWLKASELGHLRAIMNLALQFETGDGVDKDLKEALRWYKEAEKQSDKTAEIKVKEISKKLDDLNKPNYQDNFASLKLN